MLYKNILTSIFSISKLGKNIISGQADSGLNIDHMYRNMPKGVLGIGKLIDKILLNLPSVKYTRYKKEIILKILQNEVANNIMLGRKTKIIDLASGPARYLIDLIDKSNQDFIDIICIDFDKRSVNFGKILAGKKPIRYTKANIFKLDHLKWFSKKVNWIPNVIMSTGFFELQTDETVKKLLEEIYSNLDRNGLLLFTGQAKNPTKKLMRNIGKTQSGKPWELYLRPPEIFRRWLIELGFRDVIISLDSLGMYEYCTGRKM